MCSEPGRKNICEDVWIGILKNPLRPDLCQANKILAQGMFPTKSSSTESVLDGVRLWRGRGGVGGGARGV